MRLAELNINWAIRKSLHKVFYRKSFVLSQLDTIVLSYLTQKDNSCSYLEMGLDFGFALKSDPENNLYYDKSEDEIFSRILQTLERFHLVQVIQNENEEIKVSATIWGINAINEGSKFLFYEAGIKLNDLYLLHNSESIDNPFPFHKHNITSDILNEKEVKPFIFDLPDQKENFNLIKARESCMGDSTKSQDLHIDWVNAETEKYEKVNIDLTLTLISSNEQYDLGIAINKIASPELYKIISFPENSKVLSEWLLRLKWVYHLQNADALRPDEIAPYIEFIDWPIFLSDNRIEWNTNFLDILTDPEVNNLSVWNATIENCPSKIITDNIDRYYDYWNWSQLSSKLSPDFIIDSINEYPWNVDLVFDKLNQAQIEEVILSIDSLEKLGNLDDLTTLVSYDFLKQNIKLFPFNLASITSWGEEKAGELITSNPDIPWNYSFITSKYSFTFIAEHLATIGPYLDINVLLKRIIQTKQSFNSSLEYPLILEFIESSSKEITLKLGAEDEVFLNDETVAFLDKYNVLFWGTELVPGIEANINFNWSANSFELHASKIKSDRAFDNVSVKIENLQIVIENSNFDWRYDLISNRVDLNWNIEHLSQLKPELDFTSIIQRIAPRVISDNLSFFIDWSLEKEAQESLHSVISNRLSANFLLPLVGTLEDMSVEVNWHQVFKKEVESDCDQIIDEYLDEIYDLNQASSIYSALSRKCSVKYILAKPELPWDWKIVTSERLSLEDLGSEDIQKDLAQYLFWPFVINHLYTEQDLVSFEKLTTLAWYISNGEAPIIKESWTEITKKLSVHSLWKAIDETVSFDIFLWDWDYISANQSIPIDHSFLVNHSASINWEFLSGNRVLSSFFQYNKSAYRNLNEWVDFVLEYLRAFKDNWNFKRLSTINNLSWHERLVSEFEDEWDWSILSKQSSLLTKSHKGTKEILYDLRRFNRFSDKIDFEEISSRSDVILETDLIEKFINKNWNWPALSSHPLLQLDSEFLLKHSDKPWDYYVLTTSPSLKLEKSILLTLPDKSWNWEQISKLSWVDNDLILQLANKDWSLHSLCENENIIFDRNLLTFFIDKGFSDWNFILHHGQLHVNLETVTLISNSPFFNSEYWRLLSKHHNLDFTQHDRLLDAFAEEWDWQELISHEKLNLANIDLLRKYKSYLRWDLVTISKSFIPSFEVLNEFKDYLDWKVLSGKIKLEPNTLVAFKEYLDWSLVSKNTAIPFSIDLINVFKYNWDYYFLLDNPAIPIDVREHIDSVIDSIPELQLYLKLRDDDSPWAGSVYHYTHISNAFQIIKSHKILSRDKAVDHADAAGNVVLRRGDAHRFARFYFRPQTPTQFYNEALGKDINCGYYGWTKDYYGNWSEVWKSNFPQALALGLPKCPIPVFFKFDLQEIILKHREQCFISNGNMQTNWASAGPISQMLPKFNFMDVYSTIKNTSDGNWQTYINYSQQEFLIPEEFDFSDIKKYSIIVPNRATKRQLLEVIKNESDLSRRVVIDNYEHQVFHNENKKIEYEIDGDILTVWTDYQGDGHNHGKIILESTKQDSFEYLSGNILFLSKTTIHAYPDIKVRIDPTAKISVKFHDGYKSTEWSILETSLGDNVKANNDYSNLPNIKKDYTKDLVFDNPGLLVNGLMNLSNELKKPFLQKVRHYFLKEHTLIVLNAFEKYFGDSKLPIDHNLFRTFLALHDIGKPAANSQGDKSDQYRYTQSIIKNVWHLLPFSAEDLNVALALSEGDFIGEYMQSRMPLESVLSNLSRLASICEIELHDLGLLYMIYYQSDIAAYTEDDGGIRFLESLFHYKEGCKVIDSDTGFIQLSPTYWSLFLNLHQSLVSHD